MLGVLKKGRMRNSSTPRSAKWLSLPLVITLALTALTMQTARAQEVTQSDTSIVRHKELVMANGNSAQFPGGVEKFYSYILTNVTPDETCVPGKVVYVYFVIEKDGTINKAHIRSKMLSEKMRSQIVDVFEKAPKWTPAQQNGSVVRESFVCPVMFMGTGANTINTLAKN